MPKLCTWNACFWNCIWSFSLMMKVKVFFVFLFYLKIQQSNKVTFLTLGKNPVGEFQRNIYVRSKPIIKRNKAQHWYYFAFDSGSTSILRLLLRCSQLLYLRVGSGWCRTGCRPTAVWATCVPGLFLCPPIQHPARIVFLCWWITGNTGMGWKLGR